MKIALYTLSLLSAALAFALTDVFLLVVALVTIFFAWTWK
jgi:hypothetical protein